MQKAHANKQAVLCPGSCDGCILNGPLQHKQAARSLIAGPQDSRHLKGFVPYRGRDTCTKLPEETS